MDYVQERVATLHDLTGTVPDAPSGDAAVVVPMTAREAGSGTARRVFETLAEVEPALVVVPLRASAERVPAVREWLDEVAVSTQLLWCNGPEVEALLERSGLRAEDVVADPDDAPPSDLYAHEPEVEPAPDASSAADDAPRDDGTSAADAAIDDGSSSNAGLQRAGKGRDVWLGLGVAAAEAQYVVVHDADAASYDAGVVPRLLAPLADGYAFSKGYYARVEDDGLYGRLFRLFYAPLVRALAERHDAPVVEYLAAFRYALAGEFALTSELARSIRAQRAWGLEVGTLGEAYAQAGAAGTAQVDLGVHRHDHRDVDGDGGLATMSHHVGDALFRVLADHQLVPQFDELRDAYRRTAVDFVEQYAADARHNGLPHDREREREQVERYAAAVAPPGPDVRLPAWADAPCSPLEVVEASEQSLAAAPTASK